MDSDYPGGPRTNPAAYVVDSFPVDEPLPQDKKGPKVPFYFKQCEQVGQRDFYSLTSYECNYPY